MFSGTVKFFNEKKGFGFITTPDNEYFVHYSDIIGEGFKTLSKDDKVDFKVIKSDKGMKATDVMLISDRLNLTA